MKMSSSFQPSGKMGVAEIWLITRLATSTALKVATTIHPAKGGGIARNNIYILDENRIIGLGKDTHQKRSTTIRHSFIFNHTTSSFSK